MRRVAVLILLSVPSVVAAQQPDRTIRLTLSPAAAPVPALKYRLLPELKDQTPGNAAVFYYRALDSNWLRQRQTPDFLENLDKWRQSPVNELPRDKLRWVLDYWPLRQVSAGTRRQHCDWEVTDRLRTEGLGILLPELHGFRELLNVLSLRIRLELSDGEFNKATKSLQEGFGFVNHLQRFPHPIATFVAAALIQSLSSEIEAFVQQPEAPNLYWSLTDLPAPIVDMRGAIESDDIVWTSRWLHDARALQDVPVSLEEARQMLKRVGPDALTIANDMTRSQNPGDAMTNVVLAGVVARNYTRAKQFLLEQGKPAELVESMPAPQVVLLHSFHLYGSIRDEFIKWENVPYWRARPALLKTKKRAEELIRDGNAGIPLIAAISNYENYFRAAANIDRRIAALRCIEALRMYAADHAGQLPKKLSDITEVPIPIDPVTGKEFEYELADGHVVLAPPKLEGDSAQPLRYELKFRK